MKKAGILLGFSIFMGIYQCREVSSDGIAESLIGGIAVGEVGDGVLYVELVKWMLLISFFVLMSVANIREKEQMYVCEVVRCGSYRNWYCRFYGYELMDALGNVCGCIVIWEVMDVIAGKGGEIALMSVVLFLMHLLCCVTVICLLEECFGNSICVYIPLIIEAGTILAADRYRICQIWFPGIWGMYIRSGYVNEVQGFQAGAVICIELFIIMISNFIAVTRARRNGA